MGIKLLGSTVVTCLVCQLTSAQQIPNGTYEFRDTAYGEMTTVETVERFTFSDNYYYAYRKAVNYIKGTPARTPMRSPQILKDTSNRGSFTVKGGYMYFEDHSQVASMLIDSSASETDSITLTFDPRTSENCSMVAACWIILTEILPDKTDNFLKQLNRSDKDELPYQITIPKPKGRLYIKVFPPDYAWFELTLKATKNMTFRTYHKVNRSGDGPQVMVVGKMKKEGIELQHVHHKQPRFYKRIN